jgi:hypothetical protein
MTKMTNTAEILNGDVKDLVDGKEKIKKSKVFWKVKNGHFINVQKWISQKSLENRIFDFF